MTVPFYLANMSMNTILSTSKLTRDTFISHNMMMSVNIILHGRYNIANIIVYEIIILVHNCILQCLFFAFIRKHATHFGQMRGWEQLIAN